MCVSRWSSSKIMLTLCRVIIFIDGGCNFPRACARRQQKRVNEDSCEANKNATQTLNLLHEVYEVDALLRARMSELQKKFSEGRGDKEGDERHGHPVTTKTNEYVKTVRNHVRTDRRFNSRMTEELKMKTDRCKKC